MKKCLAAAIAVAMLASMSVSAMSSPAAATADTDVGIVFTTWGGSGNDATPSFGVHNPGNAGDLGGPYENDNWPVWVENMQSWNLFFGDRDFPAIGPVNFRSFGTTPDALDYDGNPVNDLLGIVVQAATDTNTAPFSPLAGSFRITVELNEFFVGAEQTFHGFDLELISEGVPIVGSLPAGISGTFFVAGGTVAGITQHDLTGTNALVQDTAASAAVTLPAGVLGFEWIGNLVGNFDGTNIMVGHAQADMTWTLNVHI